MKPRLDRLVLVARAAWRAHHARKSSPAFPTGLTGRSMATRTTGEIRAVFYWCLLLLIACSDSGQSPENIQGARPSLSRCRDAWNRILDFQPIVGYVPRALRWHAGNLYYKEVDGGSSRIVSLPDSGGTPSEVTEGGGFGLWIEGESLYFTLFDQLYTAPLGGGESTRVATGETFSTEMGRFENVGFYNQELDASALYWILHRSTDPTWSVWRMPRDGGRSEELGTLPDSFGRPEALVVLSDQLMIAGNDGDACLLPKDGGDVEPLPRVDSQRDDVMWSRFIGAAPSGIVWAVASQKKIGDRIPYTVVLSTPDGEIETLWRDMPADIEPDHAWSDGAGGWVMSGLETFSDGDRHTSIWWIDAEDRAKRLACDPRPGRSSGYAETAALSDDAVYLAVEYFASSHKQPDEDPEAMGWTLIKLER
jgi:hypothetical protein